MKKEKKVWAMYSVVVGMFTTGQAIAQQDTIKSYDLQEVVITATKFPKSRSETGKVLNIITAEQLAQSAGKDLSQLLNEQVGLVVGGANSNPGKDKSVFLRGAGSEYTLLLLDGVPVNDPSGVGGAFDLRLLPIDQIERVEILKGSQSTLYGTDAIAGVINIITKKGGARPVGVTGTLTGGSYRTGKAQVGLNGHLQKFDYNLGYTYFDTQGISEARDETGQGNFDKDGYRQHAFQANLGFQATSKLSLKPFLRTSNFDGQYDGGGFTDDPTARYTAKLLNAGLLAQYKLNRGAVNVQYAYDRTDRTFSTSAYQSAFQGSFNNAEIFLNYNLTSYLQLLAGTSFQDLRMLDTTAIPSNPSITITSPYVSFFLHNLKGFSMELGGRYNHHSRYGENYTYSFNPSYLLNEKWKLFFNYSTGFKAPTLYQLYGQYGHNENLKPERSQSTEGGVEAFLADGKIDIRVVAFDRKVKDAIQYTYTPGYINLNTQHDHGLEIEPTVQVNKKMTIRAYYAYVTGAITTKTGERDTTYFNLLRRPKHSFGLNVSYQVTPALLVSANLKTFSKRSDLFFNPTTYSTEQVSLAAYQLLTVYAEYQVIREKLRFFVDAKNVLNQDYSEVYGYNTQGFNINLGISFKY